MLGGVMFATLYYSVFQYWYFTLPLSIISIVSDMRQYSGVCDAGFLLSLFSELTLSSLYRHKFVSLRKPQN